MSLARFGPRITVALVCLAIVAAAPGCGQDAEPSGSPSPAGTSDDAEVRTDVLDWDTGLAWDYGKLLDVGSDDAGTLIAIDRFSLWTGDGQVMAPDFTEMPYAGVYTDAPHLNDAEDRFEYRVRADAVVRVVTNAKAYCDALTSGGAETPVEWVDRDVSSLPEHVDGPLPVVLVFDGDGWVTEVHVSDAC